ncbi:hypothetical protein Tco_0422512 [Tanacetum coccineum]
MLTQSNSNSFHHPSPLMPRLDEATQAILDARGIFLYQTPNEAHQLLEDRVLLKLIWSKDMKAKPIRKTVAFAESSNNSKLSVLTHRRTVPTSLWEVPKMKKPTMPTEVIEEEDIEETTMAGVPKIGETVNQEMKTGTRNLEKTHLPFHQHSKTSSKNPTLKKTMREFMVAQKSSNDFVKNQFFNLKTKVDQGQKNHQASIQDLETKFGRLSDQCSTRPTGSLPSNTQTNPKPSPANDKPYRPPSTRNEHVNAIFTWSGLIYPPPINLNAKTTVIHDDSEDEVDEAEKEVESSSSKQTKSDPPPFKAYKPKIPYP